MTELHDRFSRAIETGVRMDVDWRPLERRIRDTIPDLAAASYDREPPDPIVWCDRHGRPVSVCRAADEFCEGRVDLKHHDPTGDAAVGNRAYQDAGEFQAHAKRACHHLEQMEKIAGRYKPTDPRQVEEVEQVNQKADGCELCARVDQWNAPHTTKPTDVGGILDHPRLVCSPHYDFIRTRGRLPSEDEDRRYARTGRWPKIRQTERLAAGIRSGVL